MHDLWQVLLAISSLSSFFGSLLCAYLMQVILREKSPLVYLQRAALVVLGISLFANSISYYPEWALVDNHRPTGIMIDISIFLNLLAMAVRGRVVLQRWMHQSDHP